MLRGTFSSGGSGRAILISAGVCALLASPIAIAGTGDTVRVGKRVEGDRETRIISNATTYTTRQSNSRVGDGGAATYGCRAAIDKEACLFVNNTRDGRAFDFRSKGLEAGRILVTPPSGKTAKDVAPFTTNANGIAQGFNADQVDGKGAEDFAAATAVRTLGITKMALNDTPKEILKVGVVTLTAQCRLEGADEVAEILISTTQNGVSFDGLDPSPAINTDTPAADRQVHLVTSAGGAPAYSTRGDVSVIAPDGTLLHGAVSAGVNTQGTKCVFGGALTAG